MEHFRIVPETNLGKGDGPLHTDPVVRRAQGLAQRRGSFLGLRTDIPKGGNDLGAVLVLLERVNENVRKPGSPMFRLAFSKRKKVLKFSSRKMKRKRPRKLTA